MGQEGLEAWMSEGEAPQETGYKPVLHQQVRTNRKRRMGHADGAAGMCEAQPVSRPARCSLWRRWEPIGMPRRISSTIKAARLLTDRRSLAVAEPDTSSSILKENTLFCSMHA